jgi:hypothetical protein
VIRLEGMECFPRLLHAIHLGRLEGHDNDSLQAYIFELIDSAPLDARTRLLELAMSESDEERSDAAWLLGLVHQHITSDVLIASRPTSLQMFASRLAVLSPHSREMLKPSMP